MSAIKELRKKITTDVFTSSEFESILGTNKYSILSKLLKTADVIRVRRGLYVFGKEYRNENIKMLPLANLVYGPSYVSLESMLYSYNMIPEAVKEITSVNYKKTKLFTTKVGRFRYRIIPKKVFSMGIVTLGQHGTRGQKSTSFIAATREKAILDTLYLSNTKNHYKYLLESLRIEPQHLLLLNKSNLFNLAINYDSKAFVKRINIFIKELN